MPRGQAKYKGGLKNSDQAKHYEINLSKNTTDFVLCWPPAALSVVCVFSKTPLEETNISLGAAIEVYFLKVISNQLEIVSISISSLKSKCSQIQLTLIFINSLLPFSLIL